MLHRTWLCQVSPIATSRFHGQMWPAKTWDVWNCRHRFRWINAGDVVVMRPTKVWDLMNSHGASEKPMLVHWLGKCMLWNLVLQVDSTASSLTQVEQERQQHDETEERWIQRSELVAVSSVTRLSQWLIDCCSVSGWFDQEWLIDQAGRWRIDEIRNVNDVFCRSDLWDHEFIVIHFLRRNLHGSFWVNQSFISPRNWLHHWYPWLWIVLIIWACFFIVKCFLGTTPLAKQRSSSTTTSACGPRGVTCRSWDSDGSAGAAVLFARSTTSQKSSFNRKRRYRLAKFQQKKLEVFHVFPLFQWFSTFFSPWFSIFFPWFSLLFPWFSHLTSPTSTALIIRRISRSSCSIKCWSWRHKLPSSKMRHRPLCPSTRCGWAGLASPLCRGIIRCESWLNHATNYGYEILLTMVWLMKTQY